MIPVGFPSSRAGFVIFFFICARACGSIALPAARIWRVRVVGARVPVTRAIVGNFSRFRAGFGRFFILGLFYMRVLDLYSGTGTVKRICAENPAQFECVSLDLAQADINCGVMEWDYTTFPRGHFGAIFASPPCTCFSRLKRCNIGRTLRNGTTITAESIEADISNVGLPLLRKTQEIIQYFQPKWWFIENPQTGRMKDYIDEPNYVLDYCRYGMPYRKRTMIWTNLKDFTPLCCDKKCSGWDPVGKKHKVRVNELGGSGDRSDSTVNGGRAIRSKVPDDLIRALLHAILEENKGGGAAATASPTANTKTTTHTTSDTTAPSDGASPPLAANHSATYAFVNCTVTFALPPLG